MFMNNNMSDLEDVYKTDYVDYRFHGSTSIKKFLPVLLMFTLMVCFLVLIINYLSIICYE